MARRKEIRTVTWSGEMFNEPRKTVLVLHETEDPERTLFLSIAPTNARRLQKPLEELLQRVKFYV